MGSKTNLNLTKLSLESLTLLHAHEGERMPRVAYSNIKHVPCRIHRESAWNSFVSRGKRLCLHLRAKQATIFCIYSHFNSPQTYYIIFNHLECFVLFKVSLAEKTLMMTRPVEVLWHEKSCQTWCCVAECTLVMLADVLVLVMRSWLCVGGAVLFRV